jgi:hypothetical protein
MPDNAGVHVRVAFYRPNDNSPFMNRMVALLTGGYCHVELNFPMVHGQGKSESWMSTSIQSHENVFLRQDKTFANPGEQLNH